jgi:LysM repeat protein
MVDMDTIKQVNGLKNNKVKKGDVLKIPLKRVNYDVIQKDINKLAEDSTIVMQMPGIKKDEYNVALLLPFFFDKNDVEMSKTLKLGQIREMYGTTKIAYDFYQGFKFAADSLSKAGFNVNLHVYDTKGDTNTISSFFKKSEFNEMDLVVGPLFDHTMKYTTAVCQQKGIRIVLPFKSKTKVLHKNPYVYNSVASNMTLIDGTVDYLVEHKSHCNIIILEPYNESDKALYNRARDRFNEKIAGKENAYNKKIVEIGLGSSGGREMNTYIKKDTVNIVIVPSDDIKFVSGAMNRMNKVMNLNPYAKGLKVVAFGFEDWNKFNDLDILHRNRMYQHYSSYRYVDYNSDKGIEFIRAYRHQYGLDPNVYSVQGFDVGMYFMSALHLYGVNFDQQIENHQMDLIQNDFQFESLEAGSGRENKRVCIVKYDNYQLYQLK